MKRLISQTQAILLFLHDHPNVKVPINDSEEVFYDDNTDKYWIQEWTPVRCCPCREFDVKHFYKLAKICLDL